MMRPDNLHQARDGKGQEEADSALLSRFRQGVIVIGAGTMGRGIAQFFLQHSFPVTLVDLGTDVLQRAQDELRQRLRRLEEKGSVEPGFAEDALSRLLLSTEQGGHDGQLIIEAVVEKMEVKKELFQNLTEQYGREVIYASNTSSLSISEMASATACPERILGIHFFNPAPLMPLVEVIQALETAPQLVEQVYQLLKQLGKTPVKVQDTPGFIVNRVARPYYNEALKIYGEGLAPFETIDRIMKGAGFKMGPFELQDLIGLDINFATTASLHQAYHGDPRFRPHPLQERMVKSRRLGRKTGKGYYSYE